MAKTLKIKDIELRNISKEDFRLCLLRLKIYVENKMQEDKRVLLFYRFQSEFELDPMIKGSSYERALFGFTRDSSTTCLYRKKSNEDMYAIDFDDLVDELYFIIENDYYKKYSTTYLLNKCCNYVNYDYAKQIVNKMLDDELGKENRKEPFEEILDKKICDKIVNYILDEKKKMG